MKLLIEDLKKAYAEKEVLKGISYTFEQGRIYGLLGRNGAGKTTFFNCLNEDTDYESGTCTLVYESGSRALKTEDIGYVQSEPVVPDFLTAREMLRFFLEINGDSIHSPLTPDEYLDFIGIPEDSRGTLMRDFSHGMKNKIQMLIQIIANPAVLLLDEPLTSLDVVAADEMKSLLRRRKEEHITVLSTHIMDLALDLCDEIVVLNDGVLQRPENEGCSREEYKDRIIAMLKGDENA